MHHSVWCGKFWHMKSIWSHTKLLLTFQLKKIRINWQGERGRDGDKESKRKERQERAKKRERGTCWESEREMEVCHYFLLFWWWREVLGLAPATVQQRRACGRHSSFLYGEKVKAESQKRRFNNWAKTTAGFSVWAPPAWRAVPLKDAWTAPPGGMAKEAAVHSAALGWTTRSHVFTSTSRWPGKKKETLCYQEKREREQREEGRKERCRMWWIEKTETKKGRYGEGDREGERERGRERKKKEAKSCQ